MTWHAEEANVGSTTTLFVSMHFLKPKYRWKQAGGFAEGHSSASCIAGSAFSRAPAMFLNAQSAAAGERIAIEVDGPHHFTSNTHAGDGRDGRAPEAAARARMGRRLHPLLPLGAPHRPRARGLAAPGACFAACLIRHLCWTQKLMQAALAGIWLRHVHHGRLAMLPSSTSPHNMIALQQCLSLHRSTLL